MGARFLILIAVAGVLAVYLATRTSSSPVEEGPSFEPAPGETGDIAATRNRQKRLDELDLPGEEPPDVDLSIQVEVDPSGRKNRLYYYITEAHGYYVETFYIDFFYKPTPDTVIEDSPLVVREFINKYLKANDTLFGCLEVVPAELYKTAYQMGTSENWDARITDWGRARVANPERLHPLVEASSCD